MIQNDTLQRWYRKAVDFFQRRPEETKTHYALRVFIGALAVGTILGLGVFATVATAGTWWYAAELGAKKLPGIQKIAAGLRSFAVSIMSLTTLTFNIVNSLKSAKELAQISLRKRWENIKYRIGEYRKVENNWQFYNPLRALIVAITEPFTWAVFAGHLYSMGEMGDKLGNVDPKVTAGLNAASEGLTDFHMIFPENHQAAPAPTPAEQPKNGENAKPQGEPAAEKSEEPIQQPAAYPTVAPSPLKAAEPATKETAQAASAAPATPAAAGPKQAHSDHTHANIAGKALLLILSPLYLLSVLWDYGFSHLNKEAEKRLTFKQALKKSVMGLSKKVEVQKPKLSSSSWLQIEKSMRIQKAIAKHCAAILKADPDAVDDLEAIDLLRKQALQPTTKNRSYLTEKGAINSESFFAAHTSLSLPAQALCKKIIETANSPEYEILAVPAPIPSC